MSRPKTYAEACRRHARATQGLIAASRRTELPEPVRRYYDALGREGLKLLEQLQAEPPDAPYVGRRAAIPCRVRGCSGFSWADARTLYDRERAGKPTPPQLCPACHEAGVGPQGSHEEAMPRPLEATDLAELVEHRLEQVIELDRLIFRDPDDPELQAAHRIGRLAHWAHLWRLYQDEIAKALGADEAAKRLQDARETAGTAALLVLSEEPEPVTDPDREDPPSEPDGNSADEGIQRGRQDEPAGSIEEGPPGITEKAPDITTEPDEEPPWVF